MGVFLAGCLVVAGCHQSPLTSVCAPPEPTVRLAGPDPRPDPRTQPLMPATMLKWTISSAKKAQLPPVTGESVVRPDGKVDLGPYGFVAVAGLTPQQASDAIAAHMRRYVADAHVHLVAYLHPSGGASAPGRRLEETPVNPITPTGYQPGPVNNPPLVPVAAPTPPALVRTTVQPVPGVKEKPKEPEGANKPEETEGRERGEGMPAVDAAALAGPPLPPPGPDGHAPNELHKVSLPAYVIEPPDILLVEYLGSQPIFNREQAVRGQHLVRPDGTIGLGIFGSVHVAGLTLEQARLAVYEKLRETSSLDIKLLSVDVLAFNSKVYYVITDGAGYGEQIYRFPVFGSETVLDALANIGGLPPVATKKRIWVARRTPDGGPPHILPVDYIGTTQDGLAGTNYQIMPGDRVYVCSLPWVKFDTRLARFLSPFERILGTTLLGSETVNSIKGTGAGIVR
jgi:polysaccharide export outer membrane protein